MLEPRSKFRPSLINYFKKQISSNALAFRVYGLPVYPCRIDEREEDEDRGINLRVLSIAFAAVSLFFLFFSQQKWKFLLNEGRQVGR